jgi:hypothetical protein
MDQQCGVPIVVHDQVRPTVGTQSRAYSVHHLERRELRDERLRRENVSV